MDKKIILALLRFKTQIFFARKYGITMLIDPKIDPKDIPPRYRKIIFSKHIYVKNPYKLEKVNGKIVAEYLDGSKKTIKQ